MSDQIRAAILLAVEEVSRQQAHAFVDDRRIAKVLRDDSRWSSFAETSTPPEMRIGRRQLEIYSRHMSHGSRSSSSTRPFAQSRSTTTLKRVPARTMALDVSMISGSGPILSPS